MIRWLFRCAILTLAIAGSVAAQPIRIRPAQKAPLPPRGVRPGPGIQAIERWSRMTPEQRRRALDRLPPERRARIEQQLERYQSMTPEQREQLRFRAQTFAQLPPEKQEQARGLFRQFNQLPADRKAALRGEFRNLRSLPPADRASRLESDEFRSGFDNREQRILRELSNLTQ